MNESNDFGFREPASARSHSPLVTPRGMLFCLALAVGVGAFSGYKSFKIGKDLSESKQTMVESLGVRPVTIRHLAPRYSDSIGNLFAEPPADPAKLINPETLVLAYGEDSDLDEQPIRWESFQEYLSKVTGKKVTTQIYNHTADDVKAIADSEIHIVALHAADTPFVVNNAGLVPVAILGNESAASGNHLDLLVKPDSRIKKLADLRGRILTSTVPTSIVGHRVAVAVLLQEAKLQPNVDYFVNYSFGQTRSLTGLLDGDYEAVAISDDKLQSLLRKEKVKPTDYRIVYESQIVPRFCIGYVYNLDPDLAAKITQAILEFKNEQGPADELSGKPMRFVKADYKKDFDFVRKIDELFEPRLGYKQSKP
jgi:phosphonate transport system substrate-binding protein